MKFPDKAAKIQVFMEIEHNSGNGYGSLDYLDIGLLTSCNDVRDKYVIDLCRQTVC